MLIRRHHDLPLEQAAGWRASRLAGVEQGAGAFEVWRLVLDAGIAGPWASSAVHQVVLALAGTGKLRLASGPYRFSAPCTLEIAPNTEHQFVNLGAQELQLIAVRAIAPISKPRPCPMTRAPPAHRSKATP